MVGFLLGFQAPAPEIFDLTVARSYVATKEYLSAVEFYRKYLAVKPDDEDAAQELVDCHLQLQQASEATAILDRLKQDSPGLHRRRAIAHRAAALQIYQNLLKGSPSWHALTGHFRFEAGRYREAFYHYRQALARSPDFPAAHAAISEIYHRTGHPDWAETEVQLEKNRPATGSYKMALDHLQAVQAALLALGKYPTSWQRFDAQARSAKNHAEAAVLFRKALELSPGNQAIERELAVSLWLAGKFSEAEPLLSRHEMLVELAAVQLQAGETDKANATLLRHGLIRDVETAKLHARVSLELNRPGAAVPLLQAYAEQDTDGSIHLLLGRAYQALHQPNPAGLALQNAEKLRKTNNVAAETEITPPI